MPSKLEIGYYGMELSSSVVQKARIGIVVSVTQSVGLVHTGVGVTEVKVVVCPGTMTSFPWVCLPVTQPSSGTDLAPVCKLLGSPQDAFHGEANGTLHLDVDLKGRVSHNSYFLVVKSLTCKKIIMLYFR